MAYYEITIEETGERFRCDERATLLEGMEGLGKTGIPVGCRGGGCGVCKIETIHGSFGKRVMSRAHISEDQESAGIVLACRVRPTSAMTVRVLGQMKMAVLRVGDGLSL